MRSFPCRTKQGVVEFATALAQLNIKILSTGGTARVLREAGLPVVDVAAYTESPEVMDGRVKTLHPRVHGGLLMRDTESDRKELASIGGKTIDLVCVNLYPFERTVARGAPQGEVIENIDIGGPSMLRSAAKNHARVTVVTDPADYAGVISELKANGETTAETRAQLAGKTFALTAAYDAAIAGYLTSPTTDSAEEGDESRVQFPQHLILPFEKGYGLRYGENPHQQGAYYIERGAPDGSLARAESLGAGGKELSFNNFVDVDAALEAVREFEGPAAVVVKHTNPCGVATAADLPSAYRVAREADALSAFGGIVALNGVVDAETAKVVAETFIECVVAPEYTDGALDVLRSKKNLRILATGKWLPAQHAALDYKRIGGGLVVQQRNATAAGEVEKGKIASKRAPSAEEQKALAFAWRVCKHTKSNAIVFAKEDRTVGVGAGQMSRVVSVELAAKKAGAQSQGAVMASDAFFPFPDGVEAAAKAGITAVVQPGGSKKDADVIAAADAAGMAMILTGVRHFRH